jgi:ribonuclease D
VQFERVKGCGKLRGKKLAVLRELAAWREEEARRRDIPREHVVPDTALLLTAQATPSTPDSLGHLHCLSSSAFERYAADMLACVVRGIEVPRRECPRLGPHRRRANVRTMVDKALAFVRSRCEEQHIDPQMTVTRAELTSLAHDPDLANRPCRLLRGWRKEFVGEDVLRIISRK